MSKTLRRSRDLYSFILKFYPKDYRQEFGEEMEYVFSESLKDANSGDGEGAFNFWIRTISDTSKSLIKENVETLNKRDMKNKYYKEYKNIIRPLIVTALILLVPFVMTEIGDKIEGQGWYWKLGDYIIIGALVFIAGLVIEFLNRKIKNKNHKIIAIAIIVFLALVTWVHFAVGIIDSWPLAGS